MNEARRSFYSVLVHFLLGLAGCIVYSFVRPLPVDILPVFVTGYRLRAGLSLFVSFMPALQISGLLIGYTLAFSRNSSENIGRWSVELLTYLKGAFTICLICISLYVILAEGITPFIEERQEQSIVRTGDYNDFISVARNSLFRGMPEEAEFQINRALQIWPKSKDAISMLDGIRLELAGQDDKSRSALAVKSSAETEQAIAPPGGLTVRAALDKAEAAEKTADFYSAHYFAMLAWSIAPSTDPAKAEAMKVASSAWNRITAGSDYLKTEGDRRLYGIKHGGYEAIQRKDYLKAYYIFLELREQELNSGEKKTDPDIVRFLEVSRRGVLESFFFIDETLNKQLFETARDVFFAVKRPDGSVHTVFIRGVTYTKNAGKDMVYLRDFEYARFDRNNVLQYQISVPYVKMYPYNTAEGRAFPELMLKAVNRKIAGNEITPAVLYGEVPPMEQTMLRLDMPYADFNLLVRANKGAPYMSLVDLLLFVDKAERYGYSSAVYLKEMMSRLSDPFLMLIASIYALVLGWKYRLGKNVLFKAWWILPLPLFPVLSLFAVSAIRYIGNLCIVVFIGLVPHNSILVMLAFLSLCFLLLSVYFFSQRSE
jgi:hypothetical protein